MIDRTTLATHLSILHSGAWVASQRAKGLQAAATDKELLEDVAALQKVLAKIVLIATGCSGS